MMGKRKVEVEILSKRETRSLPCFDAYEFPHLGCRVFSACVMPPSVARQRRKTRAMTFPSRSEGRGFGHVMMPLSCGAADAEEEEDDELPLAAAARMPTEDDLVVAVEHILEGEDVQTFNIKALMIRLGACPGLVSKP